jgi:hypothetical protein
MKALAHLLCALTGFAVFLLPGVSAAQSDRDFVFDDEEGYRILRFARIGSGELTEDQLYEVSNAEFSSMVHDRIYADVLFDMEPVDSEWSESQAPLITRYLDHRVPEFASRTVECRSTSCRIMLEHSGEWTITSHQGLMESVQLVIEEFVDANAEAFDSAFLITAYFQEFEAPHIKAFLRRADASH